MTGRSMVIFMTCLMSQLVFAHFPEQHAYLTGFGGASIPHNPGLGLSTKTGYDLGFALGFKQSQLRYEAEFSWQRADTNFATTPFTRGGRANIMAIMANLHYDFEYIPLHPKLVPSIGVGLGWAHLNNSVSGFDTRNDNALGYQAMANLRYHISHRWSVALGYKYFGTTTYGLIPRAALLAGAGQVNKTWHSHMINLGVSFCLT